MVPHARIRRGLSLAGALFAALFLTQCSCSGGSGDVASSDLPRTTEPAPDATLSDPPTTTDPDLPPVDDGEGMVDEVIEVVEESSEDAAEEIAAEIPDVVAPADPPTPTPDPTDEGGTGTIVGRVVFTGKTPPNAPPLQIGMKESAGCCEMPMDETNRSVRIDGAGGVMDAVVWVGVKGREAKGAGQTLVMDQVCCRYEPHVLVVPQGASVRFDNSDGVTHNVHTFARKNGAVNNNVAAGTNLVQEYTRDEEIPVKCDIHPWMSAYVFVAESEFTALSAADGTFRLENVPAGDYTLKIWHEKLKKVERRGIKVSVAPGETTRIDVEMK